jgi:hypothetical protein
MWRYNFRNERNYPWREDNTQVEIETVQSHIESSSGQSESTSLHLGSTQESVTYAKVVHHIYERRTTKVQSRASC